ncbi:Integral membrane protein, yggt family [Granulibacter bethesdensis]|uniref:Integral membrane protein, yggt family n=2 Tax=Granulibacter bethesdensis TaxID=364410 RepID=Q0BVH6_GRABC|nr:Integral membrane protein, yggt family [Granulibacter bethesdensis CGDNIH1]AHJ62035.1 Integral membrane protein, yggt family [Granulibacter bethesdensis]AHJ67276.1 Integral membrane protein, yggt family [Granulibacter bethesdensis]APH50953.1 Integral membrane protein, yggt family [Granulibacter bethesdensis]APH58573.1 Integral membrane protein, yggt family [Granulibacter bethesdensis]
MTETLRVLTIAFNLLDTLIQLYIYALILSAIISTLMSFGVLDSRNRLVWSIADFLYRVTEPVLRPVRSILPNMGAIDLSPLIVLLVLQLLVRPMLGKLYIAIAFGQWNALLQ